MKKRARLHLDAYFTGEGWLVDIGMDHVPLPPGVVWEPACGAGHLCRALQARGRTVVASDIFDWGWPCTVRDFFDFDAAPPGVTSIFTNPPFKRGVAERFVAHALDLMAPVGGTVAMLLAHDWITAGSGRERLFAVDGPFDRVIVPTGRPRWFFGDDTVGKAPIKTYCWYVWTPTACGRPGQTFVVTVPKAPRKAVA